MQQAVTFFRVDQTVGDKLFTVNSPFQEPVSHVGSVVEVIDVQEFEKF